MVFIIVHEKLLAEMGNIHLQQVFTRKSEEH